MSNEAQGQTGMSGGDTIAVPVVDVHMEQISMPALPPLPALPPVPSLEDVLASLRNIQLPTFPPPEATYDGVPPPPPLDFAQLLQPLSSITKLFGSGQLSDLSSTGIGSGAASGVGDATSIIKDLSTLARPLDILENSGKGLSGQLDRGDRAVDDLDQSWDSQGGESAVAKARAVETSKKGLKAQGDAISQYTREATVIVSNAKAQIAAVQTRLSAQLAALSPTAGTPGGQAAIVAAIASATAESEAIVASAKAQLVSPISGVTAASEPVPTPTPSQSSESGGKGEQGIYGRSTSALQSNPAGRSHYSGTGDNSAPSTLMNAIAQKDQPVSVMDKAQAAVSLAQRLSSFVAAPSTAGASAGASRSSSAPTRTSSTPTSRAYSTSGTARTSTSGHSSSSKSPSTPSVGAASAGGGAGAGIGAASNSPAASTALPTYTAAAEASTAAPAQGSSSGAGASSAPKGGAVSQTGAMPMMPMGGMGAAGAGAAGAGGGKESISTPDYLVSADNGAEILGERLDVAPGVIGEYEVRDSPAPSSEEKNVDSTRLNLP